ncbi:6519_t:CDS:2 [Scutellospora calospora]|uniref:6519_t:CDS:1 n=1 Tax=Scutellospora calospora TaxID=85575 RepID=A0ACA9L9N0_9GLOM|nr:6519_t:CDS:2 [Scutellospora calospora]
MKSPKSYAKIACISCAKSKRRCEAVLSYQSCKRCVKEHLQCIYPDSIKKRGPKLKQNSLESITQLRDEGDFNSQVSELNKESITENYMVCDVQLLEKIKPDLSDRCANCYEQKKGCKHSGIPGKFRCERCRKRKTACLIQCIECYKKNSEKKEKVPRCNNCKVIMEDPPLDYNFIREDDKIYLKFSDNAKIEITQEKFKDLLKLQITGSNFSLNSSFLDDVNYQSSFVDGSSYSYPPSFSNVLNEPRFYSNPNYYAFNNTSQPFDILPPFSESLSAESDYNECIGLFNPEL